MKKEPSIRIKEKWATVILTKEELAKENFGHGKMDQRIKGQGN